MTKREYLKEMLLFASPKQINLFKSMYSFYNMQESLDETIGNLDISDINNAIKQCENTKDIYLCYTRHKKLQKLNI